MKGKRWVVIAAVVLACAGTLQRVHPQPPEKGGRGAAYGGAGKVLLPHESWPCAMPGGIPVPERGVPVFEAVMKLDQVHDLGKTPYGYRTAYVAGEGTVTGDKIKGSVMPGGLDFQLHFANGAMEIEQIFVLRTDDGKYICMRSPGTAADRDDVRMVPDFEAPTAGAYAWLNEGKYAGRRILDPAAGTLKISVFDVSSLVAAANANDGIRVTKPADVRKQAWDYRKAAPGEQQGDVLITENVLLGGSQSVGATKMGNRNIIPITGGTFTGKLTGKILPGGADYQNLAKPPTIDARYLWQTDDGEVIIVRNGGSFGSLVPTFEVRSDSKYAWLNDGMYLSSNPGMGVGGVSLTFYESR
ncbi:MAG: DUF3237 domain-containing protein [Acidobacteria bacterium]|jgi:hypothetical protein|nr:DUF3237 domain-containing protein [Acidobacteriota bacterium]